MRKLARLIREAKQSCKFRGHQMKPFKHFGESAWSECRWCKKSVAVCKNPPPNGIDIGGEAVSLGCND